MIIGIITNKKLSKIITPDLDSWSGSSLIYAKKIELIIIT